MMTQMQIPQVGGDLPGIGAPTVRQGANRGGKSFFELLTRTGTPQGAPKGKADEADAQVLSMAVSAVLIPGLIPQIPVVQAQEVQTAPAEQTISTIGSGRVLPAWGETLWNPQQAVTEPLLEGGLAGQMTPTDAMTAESTAKSGETNLPEFRLVMAEQESQTEVSMPQEVAAQEPSPELTQAAPNDQPIVREPELATRQETKSMESKPHETLEIRQSEETREPERPQFQKEERAGVQSEQEQTNEQLPAQPMSLTTFMLRRNAAVSAPVQEMSVPVQEPVQQLAEEIKVFAQEGSGEYVVELTPQELGRVTIHLELKDGALTLCFKADNPATQSLLMAGTGELKTTLENALARPVIMDNPARREDGAYQGQETFDERKHRREAPPEQRKHKPREAFAGVIGRIKAG